MIGRAISFLKRNDFQDRWTQPYVCVRKFEEGP